MKKKTKRTFKNRSQKRVAMTRRKLKRAALNVFSDKGVEATTVEDITQKADLGKGTLYRHFTDKDEMVITLIEDAIENLISRLRLYSAENASLEDVLEHFLSAHYAFFTENCEEFILLFQGRLFLKLNSEPLENLEGPFLRYLKEIEDLVWPYVSSEISPAKIRRLACAIAGFISGYFSFAMIGMDEDEIESSVKPLKKAFVKTLCVFLDQD
ncbi:MAG: TetR/AcrR family transcriptional regulator [Phycisphaerae bacterium]|nr:TetR/AcrR family transcriptional regulator [Phycisphaerae bacterium]